MTDTFNHKDAISNPVAGAPQVEHPAAGKLQVTHRRPTAYRTLEKQVLRWAKSVKTLADQVLPRFDVVHQCAATIGSEGPTGFGQPTADRVRAMIIVAAERQRAAAVNHLHALDCILAAVESLNRKSGFEQDKGSNWNSTDSLREPFALAAEKLFTAANVQLIALDKLLDAAAELSSKGAAKGLSKQTLH